MLLFQFFVFLSFFSVSLFASSTGMPQVKLTMANSVKVGVHASLQDSKELVFGANVSQSRAIEELQKASQPVPFQRMADHLLRIAGMLTPICWAPAGPLV